MPLSFDTWLSFVANDNSTPFELCAASRSSRGQRRRETVEQAGGKTLAEWAAHYEASRETLGRWMRRGSEAGDLPPLAQPEQMALWWQRMKDAGHFKWKCPEVLTRLAAAGSSAASPAAAKSATTTGTAPPMFAVPVFDAETPDAIRILIEFMKRWEDEMVLAQKTADSSRFHRAYSEHAKCLERYRAWEKDEQKKRKDMGLLLDVDSEKAALMSIFSTIGATFTQALEITVERLKPEMPAEDRRAFVLPFRDKIFQALKRSKFADVVPREEIASLAA